MILLILSGSLVVSVCSAGKQTTFPLLAEGQLDQRQHWTAFEDGRQVAILGDLLRSEQAAALVVEALEANPGLQQTLLTLRIRQMEHRQVVGQRLPTIEAGLSADRQQDQDSTYTGAVTVGWEIDVWRKVADTAQASSLDVAQQAALYQAARDTLAAEVMQSWLGITAAHRNIVIEEQRLKTLEQTEAFVLRRYTRGLGGLEDLDSARKASSSSRATLAGYREVLARNQRALQAMLGRVDAGFVDIAAEYPAVIAPLAELPAQTLRRRPDLQAAYLAIEAADLRVSVAYKDLLPSINVQAVLTDAASSPASALLTNPLWSLLGQLSAPLFQGGRLMAATEIAELKTAQCYHAYRETLLTAVQEVEDAIGRERSLTEQVRHTENALGLERDNLRRYEQQYRAGLVDMLDLLQVGASCFDLEIQLNTLVHDRLANRIVLGLALGLGVGA
jgi:outer membrane protein TolC